MQLFEPSAVWLLAVAGTVMAVRAHRLISLHQRVLTWPSVPGVVVRSELREKTDGDGTSYRAELVCTYSAGGHRYTSARHTEGMSFSQPEQSARTLVAAFPVGKTVEVRVNPEGAADGVLITGKPEHMVVIRSGGLAALAGPPPVVLSGSRCSASKLARLGNGPWPQAAARKRTNASRSHVRTRRDRRCRNCCDAPDGEEASLQPEAKR